MSEDVDMAGCRSHGVRVWRWLAFDPPMRDPAWHGCHPRHVSCTACNCALGTIDDPFEAFLLAWRHRRTRRSDVGAAPGQAPLPG